MPGGSVVGIGAGRTGGPVGNGVKGGAPVGRATPVVGAKVLLVPTAPVLLVVGL